MQLNLFDGTKPFINNKPIRLIELFGGISAQATALHELDVEFEHYRYVDFDKYAVKSTNAMYGTNWETTDITKIKASDLGVVETDKYDYIMTYSFPCQDLSLAGKGMGMAKDGGTRSGLLWETERLLNEMQELPQVLLMENVPQVHGRKNIDSFNEWQDFLQRKGYKNYWQDLKATNFGIPQSRNRTFMVSLLGDYYYSFPKGFKLEYLLKDFLETEVDEKYYLSDKMINFFKNNEQKMKEKGNGFRFNVSDGNVVGKTITTNADNRMDDNFVAELSLKEKLANSLIKNNRVKEMDIIRHSYSQSRIDEKREIAESNNISPTLDTRPDTLGIVVSDKPKLVQVGNLDIKGNDSIKRVYSSNGLSPTLTTMEGGNRQPKVQVQTNIKNIVGVDSLKTNNKRLHSMLDKIDVTKTQAIDMYNQTTRDDMFTIKTTIDSSNMTAVTNNLRIRKLTPKECWRLMGFSDELFEKAQQVNSNAQLYKQAGNSIVVTVLMAIFGELLSVEWQSKVKNLINDINSNLESMIENLEYQLDKIHIKWAELD